MLNEDQLFKLRKAGKVAGEARELGLNLVEKDVKLYDVAQEVEAHIRSKGCGLAFPCNIGINEVAAHYTPGVDDPMRFNVGDVVKIDCGAEIDGYIGDTAGTVEVGTQRYKSLIESSKNARDIVVEFIGDGVSLMEIGTAVEMSIKNNGFKPIMNLCGHQIEQYSLHSGMSIPSYNNGDTTKVRAGMVIAVEPFSTNGEGMIKNGRPGNIVRILRERPMADPIVQEFFQYVKNEFKSFPFCARSCDFPNADKHTKTLIRHGILSSYAQLVEVKGGIISQHEYTFYIAGERGEVITP